MTTSNRIPLLDELFQEFPDMPMNIELKTPTEPAIKEFSRLVRKYGREHITIWGAMKDHANDDLRASCLPTVNFYSIW